jgi:import inner membrane translocase subunit TIM9
MKDFMTLYSGLVERCFMDCANDFTTTKLKAGEESCVNHCADKFLALSTRWVAVPLADFPSRLADPDNTF